MKTHQWFWVIALSAISVFLLLLLFFHHQPGPKSLVPEDAAQPASSKQIEPQKNPNPTPQPATKPAPKPAPKPQIQWGVDTASQIDAAFYKCVVSNYGKPYFVGRYLETKQDISTGLTSAEAKYLHQQGIKIIPIFNHFTNAISYKNGVAEAKAAISYAQKIGVSKGVAIFADIEPKYPVNEGFIRGWVDTFVSSPYKPGIYGVFTKENAITSAFQAAAAKNKNVQRKTIVWSSNPDPGITTKAKAPKFQPNPPKNIKIALWQYGMDGNTCNVDTDLVEIIEIPFLW